MAQALPRPCLKLWRGRQTEEGGCGLVCLRDLGLSAEFVLPHGCEKQLKQHEQELEAMHTNTNTSALKRKGQRLTDGRTDGRMDGWTSRQPIQQGSTKAGG